MIASKPIINRSAPPASGGGIYFIGAADALFQSDGLWYSDAGFTTPATDNGPALRAAIAAAAGRPVYLRPGTYYVNNAGVDEKSPEIIDGENVHLETIGGVAKLVARFVPLPTVSAGTSTKITRNVLTIENSEYVKLENILFDGGDDLVSATSDEDDIDRTYRASMLEIRSCVDVILNNVKAQRARVVTSPPDHGTAGEDIIETYRSGPVFIRDCTRVVGNDCGFGDDHRGEGWQLIHCDFNDFDQFFSAAPNVWTPLNIRGTGSVIRVRAIVENNDGSAIGVGGEDAIIDVELTSKSSGGVNLGRYLATDTRGWKSALVVIHGSEQQERSHGFGVKLEPAALARSWVGDDATYPYGALTVRGEVDGCLFGAYIAHCESVDIDLIVHEAVDASAEHGGAHSTMSGVGMFTQQCGTVKLRGKVRGDRQKVAGATAYDPEYGWLALDCEHVDADVTVRGGAFNGLRGNIGACAVSTIDGKAANGTRHFRSLKVGGSLIECAGYFGEAAQKLNSVQFRGDFLRYLIASGAADMMVGEDNLTLNVYQVLPSGVTTLEVVGGAVAIASGVPEKIDFNSLSDGFIDDIVAASDQIKPRQRGYYIVTARARLASLPAGATVEMEIRKNGVVYRGPLHRQIVGAAIADTTIGGTIVVPMNGTTDYIELWITQTNGGGSIIAVPDAWLDALWVPGVY